jgi:hypothetical protein
VSDPSDVNTARRIDLIVVASSSPAASPPSGSFSALLSPFAHAASVINGWLILPEQNFYWGCGHHQLRNQSRKENPMPNLEAAIRERAYQLWLDDGRPEGQAEIYWLNAQREILAASVESPTRNAATASADVVATNQSKKRHQRGYAWRRVV